MTSAKNIEEIKDMVFKIEEKLILEMSHLIDARDVPFAVSVYTTALSRVIGSAIALSKSEDLRRVTHEAVHLMIGMAMDQASASYTADEAIEKASKV